MGIAGDWWRHYSKGTLNYLLLLLTVWFSGGGLRRCRRVGLDEGAYIHGWERVARFDCHLMASESILVRLGLLVVVGLPRMKWLNY